LRYINLSGISNSERKEESSIGGLAVAFLLIGSAGALIVHKEINKGITVSS
jgi:hypothetical protein